MDAIRRPGIRHGHPPPGETADPLGENQLLRRPDRRQRRHPQGHPLHQPELPGRRSASGEPIDRFPDLVRSGLFRREETGGGRPAERIGNDGGGHGQHRHRHPQLHQLPTLQTPQRTSKLGPQQ